MITTLLTLILWTSNELIELSFPSTKVKKYDSNKGVWGSDGVGNKNDRSGDNKNLLSIRRLAKRSYLAIKKIKFGQSQDFRFYKSIIYLKWIFLFLGPERASPIYKRLLPRL